MKIKLDENLSRHLKPSLIERGHEISTAAEEGLLGKVDVEVGTAAKAEERRVFTLDLDFADLRKFPPGTIHLHVSTIPETSNEPFLDISVFS